MNRRGAATAAVVRFLVAKLALQAVEEAGLGGVAGVATGVAASAATLVATAAATEETAIGLAFQSDAEDGNNGKNCAGRETRQHVETPEEKMIVPQQLSNLDKLGNVKDSSVGALGIIEKLSSLARVFWFFRATLSGHSERSD